MLLEMDGRFTDECQCVVISQEESLSTCSWRWTTISLMNVIVLYLIGGLMLSQWHCSFKQWFSRRRQLLNVIAQLFSMRNFTLPNLLHRMTSSLSLVSSQIFVTVVLPHQQRVALETNLACFFLEFFIIHPSACISLHLLLGFHRSNHCLH